MTGSNSGSDDLKRVQTNSLNISPELFEKLYLSPQQAVKGDLRSTFGNPTPVAIVGLVVALSPLSIELMGWRGASGLSATLPVSLFFGGMLLIISGVDKSNFLQGMRLVLEFFLGNTFPSVVFFGYGAHFLTFGATFQPFYAAISSYTIDGSQTQTPAFMASFGFYACFMGVLSFVYLICSVRTNAIFVVIFIGATLGFVLAAGAFWSLAEGHMIGAKLLVGTGGAFFVAAMMGWYLLAAIMFAVMDLPIRLPVFDLSTVVKGRSQMDKERQA